MRSCSAAQYGDNKCAVQTAQTTTITNFRISNTMSYFNYASNCKSVIYNLTVQGGEYLVSTLDTHLRF